ncbi:hypothetical protein ACFOMH_20415, partial [Paracoccus mangrovi]
SSSSSSFEIVIVLAPLRKHGPDHRYTEDRTLSIATESAMINEGKYPKRNFKHLMALRKTLNASGICISHSGTIAGLIFPLDDLPLQSALNAAFLEITSWGSGYLGLYRI